MLFGKLCQFVSILILLKIRVAADVITPYLVGQLLKEAWKDLAPFKKTALERLHGSVFGKGRAARSTDFVIFNMSDYKFKLRENGCETGGWTNSLLPEYVIPAHTSVVFGAQSYKFLGGVTNCYLRYKSRNGKASFELHSSNSFIGRNTAFATGKNVDVVTVFGRGTNNIVRFTIQDHFINKVE